MSTQHKHRRALGGGKNSTIFHGAVAAVKFNVQTHIFSFSFSALLLMPFWLIQMRLLLSRIMVIITTMIMIIKIISNGQKVGASFFIWDDGGSSRMAGAAAWQWNWTNLKVFWLTELMKMRVNRRQKELDRWERIVGSLGFHYTLLSVRKRERNFVCARVDRWHAKIFALCVVFSCTMIIIFMSVNGFETQTFLFFRGGIFTLFLFLPKILRDLNFVNSAAEQRSDRNVRSNSNQSFSSRLSGTQQSKRDRTQTPSHFRCFTHAILNRYFFSHILCIRIRSDRMKHTQKFSLNLDALILLALQLTLGWAMSVRFSVAKISDHRETF